MTGEKGQVQDNLSMMDLFRSDVETHSITLSDGLLGLEADPGALERVESMIGAAHSIWGAAKVVDLDAAAKVARAMEERLLSAHRGETVLKKDQIQILLKGVDMLNRIAEAGSRGDQAWISEHEDEIESLIADTNGILSGGGRRASVEREGPAGEISGPSEPSPAVEPASEEDRDHSPAQPDISSDPGMLDLFCSETQDNAAALNDGLMALRNNPDDQPQLEAATRAARSVRGAARMMGFDHVAEVAREMETCLEACRKRNASLIPDQIDILLHGVRFLNRVANAAGEGGAEAVQKLREYAQPLLSSLKGLFSIGTTGSQSPPEPSPSAGGPDSGEEGGTAAVELTGVSDPAMLDLFQTEVETYVAVLNDGLLALENDPGAKDLLEALMRAAHSIKGGARVVGLDVAVRVAHAMEDCFVAAQKGDVTLGSDQIDILLQIVDLLTRLSQSIGEGGLDWVDRNRHEIDRLVGAISSIIHGENAVEVSPVEPAQAPEQAPSSRPPVESGGAAPEDSAVGLPIPRREGDLSPEQMPSEMDRTIRVTAAKIERLIGQAGEVVVSTRGLPLLSEALVELKRNHFQLLNIMDRLQEAMAKEGVFERVSDLLIQARNKTREIGVDLAEALNQVDRFSSTSATLSDRLYHEVVSVKMRPFSDGVHGLPRMVRDLARELGKNVRLEIVGRDTEVDRDILEKLDAPLNHLLRNSVDHGIEPPKERLAAGKPETGTLRLEASHRSGMLMITVSDDGRGIDLEKLKQRIVERGLAGPDMIEKMSEPELMEFLFLPGFSTAGNVTEISGRGVGLDVVRNMVQEVGGVVRAVSGPGTGVTFHMELPITLSVVRTFLVEIAGEAYAFPLARIDRCLKLARSEIETVEDRQYFRFDENNIALVDIHQVLELEHRPGQGQELFVVVVSDRLNSYGLSVDRFLGEYDLVVRPLDPRLGKVPDVSSVAVTLEGSPVLIFDVEDLVRSIDNLLTGRRLRKLEGAATGGETRTKKRILVVDDSFTVREMERKLLESKGYEVDTAVDGMDGWNAVRAGQYDMVVSDVDMPRMNGIELVKQIKRHPELKSLPVVIVSYKDKEEDRLLGLEAGADYYLTKSSFENDSLTDAAFELIGEA